jgi:hypothetical protein
LPSGSPPEVFAYVVAGSADGLNVLVDPVDVLVDAKANSGGCGA